MTDWLSDWLTLLTYWLTDTSNWLTDWLSGHDWLTLLTDWLTVLTYWLTNAIWLTGCMHDSLSFFVTEFRRSNCIQQTWQPATVFGWRVAEVQGRSAAGHKREQRLSHAIAWLVFLTLAGQQIWEMSQSWRHLMKHTKFRSFASFRRLNTADERLTCRNILNMQKCFSATILTKHY